MKQQIDSGQQQADVVSQPSRRNFLQLAGGLTGAGLFLAACGKDKNKDNGGVDLGKGDTGILNYAYALEQLEAAFYIQVIASPYTGMSNAEQAMLIDIRDHEIAHREFLKNALGSRAIQDITTNFTSINFTSRASVLTAAKMFEDLGVAAYNGAGMLLESPENLLLAGKIVSVEARHAAYIRDRLEYGTFADNTVITSSGLDTVSSPEDVLSVASAYISTKLNASNLPKL